MGRMYLEGMLVWDATGAARDSLSCDKCGILLVFDIRYLDIARNCMTLYTQLLRVLIRDGVRW